jgi:hypothetical protein
MSAKVEYIVNGKKLSKTKLKNVFEVLKYDMNNLVCCEPRKVPIPNGMFMQKIDILAKLPKLNERGEPILNSKGLYEVYDDRFTEATFLFPQMFTFGVSESVMDGKLSGYQVSYVLFNKPDEGGPTEEQKAVKNKIEEFMTVAKNYLFSIKNKIGRKDFTSPSEFRSINKIIYQKDDEDGNPIADKPPTLNSTLNWYKQNVDKNQPERMATKFYDEENDKNQPERMATKFYDEENDNAEINPLECLSNKLTKDFHLCYLTPLLTFDCLNIAGGKETASIKTFEAFYKKVEKSSGGGLLLQNKPTKYKRISQVIDKPVETEVKNDVKEEEVEEEAELGSEPEEEPQRQPSPPPKKEKKSKKKVNE